MGASPGEAALNETRRIVAGVATAVLATVLAGCAASNELRKPSTYRGDVVLTHLADTRLTLENGETVAFGDLFPGFDATPSAIRHSFPFRQADVRLVDFASLRDVLPGYDANDDDWIQEPELTVLYVLEAARGLGHPVARIDPGGSGVAIATSQADISALVRFVDRNLDDMAQPQRMVFRDLRRLALELEGPPWFFGDETGPLRY